LRTIRTADEIAARVKVLAQKITEDYRGADPVVLVVMNGAFMFAADLLREIGIRDLDVRFCGLRSYRFTERSQVGFTQDVPDDVIGRHVLVVEDIVDSGRTLEMLHQTLREKKAKTIQTVVLLDKPSGREVSVDLDYVGFSVGDVFVVGYGLDHGGRRRNLSHIEGETNG